MAKKQQRRFLNYETGLVTMLFFTFGFVFMDRLSITFLFPFIQEDLNLSGMQIGLLASALSICWAVSGYVFGSVADWIGSRKKVLVPVTFAFGLCSFISGLAQSFWVLLVSRGLMGVAEGPALPLCLSSVTQESSPERRGFNCGLVQSSSQLIGAVFGPLIIVAVAVRYNWHVAFFVVGIPGIVMALILWRYMKDGKPQAADDAPEQAKLGWRDYVSIIRQRNVWLCLLISGAAMTWLFALTTFAPIFLTATGYSNTEMSLIMAALGLGLFAWTVLVPTISDRIGRKPALVIFGLLAMTAPLLFALFHLPVWGVCIVAVLFATGNGMFPLFMAVIPNESLSPRVAASSIGLVQLVGEMVGGTAMPVLAGWAMDTYGPAAPMWIAAAGTLVAALIALGLTETAPARTGRAAWTEDARPADAAAI